ncbi:hypothetical protein BDQ94DRAFT_145398 [Aspergillus welwitschiae]|uniref:Uncharacterized protein n=1 Tax=Aspergillus welwitschiae TaxID=1341132 RepID=A0A3F3Q1I4_9EURO|nr:hypothetical protein BDQ94DRAFT_145398 [Aspergillus welwitschiae]RDH32536.1 hypothetical protein BDQ94DRAFT_145398 [Aspergillus welwitschiae]
MKSIQSVNLYKRRKISQALPYLLPSIWGQPSRNMAQEYATLCPARSSFPLCPPHDLRLKIGGLESSSAFSDQYIRRCLTVSHYSNWS